VGWPDEVGRGTPGIDGRVAGGPAAVGDAPAAGTTGFVDRPGSPRRAGVAKTTLYRRWASKGRARRGADRQHCRGDVPFEPTGRPAPADLTGPRHRPSRQTWLPPPTSLDRRSRCRGCPANHGSARAVRALWADRHRAVTARRRQRPGGRAWCSAMSPPPSWSTNSSAPSTTGCSSPASRSPPNTPRTPRQQRPR